MTLDIGGDYATWHGEREVTPDIGGDYATWDGER